MYTEIYYSAWGVKIGNAKRCIRDYKAKDVVYDENDNPISVQSLIDEEYRILVAKELVKKEKEKTDKLINDFFDKDK